MTAYTGGSPYPLAAPPRPVDELAQLRARIREQDEFWENAQKTPMPIATVIEVKGPKTIISVGGGLIEVATQPLLKLAPTQRVHVDGKFNGIVSVVDDPFTLGMVRIVAAVIDHRHVEIEQPASQGETFVALFHGEAPEPGDRVILDPSNSIILRNLGKKKARGGAPPVETGIDWDDIGGLEEAKTQMREAIESPFLDAKMHARYGKKRTKGVLLCGPPRCGKTLLGKAAATALGRLHGKSSTASGFIYVKGPEVLHPLVGKSEANVRELFAKAKAHFEEHHYPCLIFLDEGDALLYRRGTGRITGMEQTIVPQFLAEMDGLEESSAIVIVATNRPETLDPAVTGEGRLDLKIVIKRPTPSNAKAIVERALRGRPLEDQTLPEAADKGASELFGAGRALYMLRTKGGNGDRRFTLGDLVSGAMCVGLVERASSLAMRREKETGKESGIGAKDLAKAADWLLEEQRILTHEPELAEIARTLQDFTGYEKVTA